MAPVNTSIRVAFSVFLIQMLCWQVSSAQPDTLYSAMGRDQQNIGFASRDNGIGFVANRNAIGLSIDSSALVGIQVVFGNTGIVTAGNETGILATSNLGDGFVSNGNLEHGFLSQNSGGDGFRSVGANQHGAYLVNSSKSPSPAAYLAHGSIAGVDLFLGEGDGIMETARSFVLRLDRDSSATLRNFEILNDKNQNVFLVKEDGATLCGGSLVVTGGITANQNICAPNISCSSDLRLKTNIQPLKETLSLVKKLQGVTYDWKDSIRANLPAQIGFIAQDVQELLPSLIESDDSGYLSVLYGKITAVLVEAIKELSQLHNQLVQQVAEVQANLEFAHSMPLRH